MNQAERFSDLYVQPPSQWARIVAALPYKKPDQSFNARNSVRGLNPKLQGAVQKAVWAILKTSSRPLTAGEIHPRLPKRIKLSSGIGAILSSLLRNDWVVRTGLPKQYKFSIKNREVLK